MRLVAFAVLLVLIGVAGAYAYIRLIPPAKQAPAPVVTKQQPPTTTQVKAAFMGDMLAHDSVVTQAITTDGYDFTPYFRLITPAYADAAMVFCNSETPVAGDTLGVSGYPSFNAPSAFARDLVRGARCNIINLATNHMADKGQTGIDETLKVWRAQAGVRAFAGANSSQAEQETVTYATFQGIRFAFVAFMDFSNVPPPNSYSVNSYHDTALVKRLLATAREQADYVIVSAHWGVEDSHTVSQDQRATAQLFADEGADLIVGTGPHVLQPVEILTSADNRPVTVLFSIGNMLSSQLKIDELTGVIATGTFEKPLDGGRVTLKELVFTPTFMSYDWPEADRQAERLATRTNLTLEPLTNARSAIPKMFPHASYEERLQAVKTHLGPNATVR